MSICNFPNQYSLRTLYFIAYDSNIFSWNNIKFNFTESLRPGVKYNILLQILWTSVIHIALVQLSCRLWIFITIYGCSICDYSPVIFLKAEYKKSLIVFLKQVDAPWPWLDMHIDLIINGLLTQKFPKQVCYMWICSFIGS